MNNIQEKPTQLALDLPHRIAYAREDFLVSPCNEEAVKWIDLYPKWPAPALILYGDEASGKTHLSYVWQDMTSAQRIPIQDIADLKPDKILDRHNAIIIENIDHALNDKEKETNIFHLYNLSKETDAHILATSTTPPSQWNFALPDLSSRLNAAPAVAIHAPDDALLSAILVKLFHDRQLEISHDVLNFCLTRVERSFSYVRSLVDAADQIALSEKKAVTIPVIKKALENI